MDTFYHKNIIRVLLKIMAFLFPLVFIYGPFNGEENNSFADSVWKYMLGGLVFDLVILIAIMNFIL